MTRVVATADLHGTLPAIPECDILVLAGDLLPDHPVGKAERYLLEDNGAGFQFEWLDGPFRGWLREVPAKHIVGIAGNHDFVFEKMASSVRELHLPWHYLEDSGITLEDLSIWGTPGVPGLPRWAFHLDKEGQDHRASSVPPGLDILISHGPPYGISDKTHKRFGGGHVGDVYLKRDLDRLKPKVLVCGHIHEGYGFYPYPVERGTVGIYNVSLNDENYCPDNEPVILREFLTDQD